jgi:hypothetical protein
MQRIDRDALLFLLRGRPEQLEVGICHVIRIMAEHEALLAHHAPIEGEVVRLREEVATLKRGC